MAHCSQSSQSLLAAGPEEKAYMCHLCDKAYKREIYLKNHLLKIHGIDNKKGEDDNDSVFAPTATSTAEDIQQAGEGEQEVPPASKKKRIMPSDEDEDDLENLEAAMKAKESRRELRNNLNLEREFELGFGEEEEIGQVQDVDKPGTSTQAINDGLAKTLAEHEETILESDETIFNKDDSVLKKSWNSNISELTSGRDQAIMDMDVEIKALRKMVAIKDTQVSDLEVKVSEANDEMDMKDRKLKELRDIIRVKNGEIKELVEEAKSITDKVKNSPLKEELKANGKKADNKIKQQANRIKQLEAQLKAEVGKRRPDLEKLKHQANEQLTRAEHYTREEVKHLNTIAALRKKIPCSDLPGCEQGKKCAYSHVLRYAKVEQNSKQIPCTYFLNGKCKFEREEDCKYAHPKGVKNVTFDVETNAPVRRPFSDSVSSARSDSIQEVSVHSLGRTSFSKMAEEARSSGSNPPPSKRSKVLYEYDFSGSENSYNSYARDFMSKFPSTNPPVKRRRSESRGRHFTSNSNNNKSDGKNQGNSQGAQGRRSTLEAPEDRRGSRGNQYQIPIHVTTHPHPQPPHQYSNYPHYQHQGQVKPRSRSSKSRRSRSKSVKAYHSPQHQRGQYRHRSMSRDGYGQRRYSKGSSDKGRRQNW